MFQSLNSFENLFYHTIGPNLLKWYTSLKVNKIGDCKETVGPILKMNFLNMQILWSAYLPKLIEIVGVVTGQYLI